MKDHSSEDACRNGNDSASPPIRKNAKGKDQQANQDGDFDKDRSHGLALPREAYLSIRLHECPGASVRTRPITPLFGRPVAPERPGFHDTFVLARRAGGIAAVRQGLFPGLPGVVRHRPAEPRRPRFGIDRFSYALVLEGGYDLAEGSSGARSTRECFAAFQRFLFGEFRAGGVDKGVDGNAVLGDVGRHARRDGACGHAMTIRHQTYCKRRCACHHSIQHLLPLNQP